MPSVSKRMNKSLKLDNSNTRGVVSGKTANGLFVVSLNGGKSIVTINDSPQKLDTGDIVSISGGVNPTITAKRSLLKNTKKVII